MKLYLEYKYRENATCLLLLGGQPPAAYLARGYVAPVKERLINTLEDQVKMQ